VRPDVPISEQKAFSSDGKWGGYANYLALLSAEQAYQQAALNVVQAQSNRYDDTPRCFKL
jgi:hypothetical protein